MISEWVAAGWHVFFTALKWTLIWAAATGVVGKLMAIHVIMSH